MQEPTKLDPAKISAHWSIRLDGTRDARVAPGVTLITTNRRTEHGLGPVLWAVVEAGEVVADGAVWQGTRYSALVRQAMYDAERAAAALLEARATCYLMDPPVCAALGHANPAGRHAKAAQR